MTIALTLLLTALQVKMALLGLPMQYKDFVDQTMPIVENAISTAQNEINKPQIVEPIINQPTTTVSQVPQTQGFGSVVLVNPVVKDIETDVNMSSFGGECGVITGNIIVRYKTNAPKSDTLKIIYPDSIKILNGTSINDNDYILYNINYSPKITSGKEIITIEKDNITKILNIDVIEPNYTLDKLTKDDSGTYRINTTAGVYDINTHTCN